MGQIDQFENNSYLIAIFDAIYIEECIFRQQVIIKDDGTVFIILNFIFSSHVIFLVPGRNLDAEDMG